MSSSFLCPVFPFSRFLPQNPFILSKVQYKVIREIFGIPYEAIFDDAEYEMETEQHNLITNLINGRYQIPYKVIREIFGIPYEAIFDDAEYEMKTEQHNLITNLINGRYQIIYTSADFWEE